MSSCGNAGLVGSALLAASLSRLLSRVQGPRLTVLGDSEKQAASARAIHGPLRCPVCCRWWNRQRGRSRGPSVFIPKTARIRLSRFVGCRHSSTVHPGGGITGNPCASPARPASPLRGVVCAGRGGRDGGGARVLPPRLGGAQGTVVTGLLPSRGTSLPLGVWTASPSVLELRAKVLRDLV